MAPPKLLNAAPASVPNPGLILDMRPVTIGYKVYLFYSINSPAFDHN